MEIDRDKRVVELVSFDLHPSAKLVFNGRRVRRAAKSFHFLPPIITSFFCTVEWHLLLRRMRSNQFVSGVEN